MTKCSGFKVLLGFISFQIGCMDFLNIISYRFQRKVFKRFFDSVKVFFCKFHHEEIFICYESIGSDKEYPNYVDESSMYLVDLSVKFSIKYNV